MGLVAVVFLILGIVTVQISGGGILGSGAIVIGSLGFFTAGLYGWRGDRIGVTLVGNDVIIYDYFKERRIHISSVLKIYRSVDATVLETSVGRVVIDDTYFEHPSARNDFFDALNTRADLANISPVGEEKSDEWVQIKRPAYYLGVALEILGGCAFVAYGIFAITQRRGLSGLFFIVMGSVFLIKAKFHPRQT
jgi:hypothetical protein